MEIKERGGLWKKDLEKVDLLTFGQFVFGVTELCKNSKTVAPFLSTYIYGDKEKFLYHCIFIRWENKS